MTWGFLHEAARAYTVSVGIPHTPPSSRQDAIVWRLLVRRESTTGHVSSATDFSFASSWISRTGQNKIDHNLTAKLWKVNCFFEIPWINEGPLAAAVVKRFCSSVMPELHICRLLTPVQAWPLQINGERKMFSSSDRFNVKSKTTNFTF